MPLAKKKRTKRRTSKEVEAGLPLSVVGEKPAEEPEVNHPAPEGRIFEVLNWSPEKLLEAQRWAIGFGYRTVIRSYPTTDMAELLNLVKPKMFLVLANANTTFLCRRRLATLVEKVESSTEDAMLLVSSSESLGFVKWERTV